MTATPTDAAASGGPTGDRTTAPVPVGAGDTVLRPLGPTERWYWLADQVSPYNGLARVRVRGDLTADDIAAALAELQRRHPLLRAAVRADAKGRPVFVAVPGRAAELRTGPLTDLDGQWVEELQERESCRPLDLARGPAFRAVLLSTPDGLTHDLLLVVSHVVVDASSLVSLLRECVTAVAADGRGREAERTVLPPVEELIPRAHRTYRPAELLRTARSMVREQRRIKERAPVRIVGGERVPFAERRSGLVHRSVPAAALDALLAESRRQGTTVHGALGAALVRAAAEHADDLFAPEDRPGPDGSMRITLGSPVDLRARLEPRVAPEEVGAFVSMLRTNVDHRPEREFWETARSITTDMRERREQSEDFCMLHISRWVVPRADKGVLKLLEAAEASNPQNLALSNFGRVDFPERDGPLRFSEVQLAASLGASCYLGAVVVTAHDTANLNLNYLRRAISPETAVAVADRWHRLVMERCEAAGAGGDGAAAARA